MKKLTVEQVIDKLQAKIDRMELRKFNKGLDLLVTEADEYDYKIEAYEEVIEMLRKVKEGDQRGKATRVHGRLRENLGGR